MSVECSEQVADHPGPPCCLPDCTKHSHRKSARGCSQAQLQACSKPLLPRSEPAALGTELACSCIGQTVQGRGEHTT